MPRKARAAPGGFIFHVYNHGNGRLRIFNRPEDYDLFTELLEEGRERCNMRILGFCLMPTHWHIALWPRNDGDLAAFVGWVSNSHVRRWHRMHATVGGGHIYQGRYRSFPVQPDTHVNTMLHYIESNPTRGHVAESNQEWQWSSLAFRGDHPSNQQSRLTLSSWQLPPQPAWIQQVDSELAEEDLAQIRMCVKRSRPYGDAQWTASTAKILDLQQTIRNPWRPVRREFA